MAKAKTRIPASLTRVTTFSKLLALLMILIFVLFGFYLGMQYQQKISEYTALITPSPTVIADNNSCTTDSDCTFADTLNGGLCCPNTRCMDISKSNIEAVNTKWLSQQKFTQCKGRMCPMIAAVCTVDITQSNSHYTAKCVHNTCQKVYSH